MTKYVSLQMCLCQCMWGSACVCARACVWQTIWRIISLWLKLTSSCFIEGNLAELILYILVPEHLWFIDHKDKTCCWKLYSGCIWAMCMRGAHLHADIVNKCPCCGEGSTVEQNSDGKNGYWGKKAESVEGSCAREGQGSEWVRESLPSSLVRSSMGLLGGPSPICVNASTCSSYTAYFWRPPSSTDVLPSPCATWVTGAASESFSLYITCTEMQMCQHLNKQPEYSLWLLTNTFIWCRGSSRTQSPSSLGCQGSFVV